MMTITSTSECTRSINPNRLNAEDLWGGPKIYIIEKVVFTGDPKFPYNVMLEGEQVPWQPPVTVRRILFKRLGECTAEEQQWAGEKVELYRDGSVDFGKQKGVGGVRVSATTGGPTERITQRASRTVVRTIEIKQLKSRQEVIEAIGKMEDTEESREYIGDLVKKHGGGSLERDAYSRRMDELKAGKDESI